MDEKSDRREVLLAARAEREKAAAKQKEEHELLCLELEEKFCHDLGPRGQAWDMANEDNTCGEGPIAIKLGDPVAHKTWQAAPSVFEDKLAYVAPWVVYPDKAKALEILHRRPELLTRCTVVMNKLFGFSLAAQQGKF